MAQNSTVTVDVLSRTNGSVISQVSGASQTVNLNQLSIVRVHAARSAVVSYERVGNDLIVHMQDGSTVRYHSFFNTDGKGHHSELVFDDGVNPIEHATFVDTGVAPATAVPIVPGYETISDVGVLVLDGSNFDPAILGAVLGVVALGAGIAIAASSGGGGGGSSNNGGNGGEPGQPGQPGGSNSAPTLTLATFAGDNVLNKAEVGSSQVFSGTTTNVTAGRTVTLTLNGKTYTTTTAADGSWSITLPAGDLQGLADGTYVANVSVTGTDGQTISKGVTVGVDTTAPGAATDLSLVNDANLPITGPTNDNTPTLSGKAEPGSTVTVRDGGTVIGTAPVDGSGNWTFTPNPPLSDGNHNLTTVVTDPAGNTSPPSAPIAVVVDSSAPSAATDVKLSDANNNGINNAGSTNDTTPTISGKAEAGSTVTIRDGGTVLGQATTDGDGNWTFTPTTPLSEGPHNLTTEVTDAAGNSSGISTPIPVTIDTMSPAAATGVKIFNDANVEVNGITNDSTPTIKGKAEAGSTVTVRDGNDIVGTATADANGNWSITPTTPLGEGPHNLTTEVKDAAGNSSGISTPIPLNIDTQAPGAATGVTLKNDASDTITGSTNDTTPTISGKAEAGSKVTIRDGNTVLATVDVDGSGDWSYTPTTPLGEGPHNITTEVKDPAGNTSGISTPIPVTIDTLAPNVTFDPVTADNKISLIEAADGFTISGTASASEAGRTLVLTVNGVTHDVIVGTDGKWSFDVPAGTFSGQNGDTTITASLTDAAGNTTVKTDTVHIAADPLIQPELTFDPFAGDNLVDGAEIKVAQTFSGSTVNVEAGQQVTVTLNGKSYLGTVGADGKWSVSIPSADLVAAGDGTKSFDVSVSDASGNTVDVPHPFIINSQLGGLAFDPISVDGNINAAEAALGVTLSGTSFNVPAGEDRITITIQGGGTYLVAVEANGSWSIQLSAADLQLLSDGSHTITVSALDGSNQPISATTSVGIFIANLPNPSLDALFVDGILSSTEAAVAQTITGKTGISGAGQKVIVIIGGQEFNATVAADGTFSVNIPQSVLGGLANGSAPISVIATDAAGNHTTFNSSVTVDTLAPTLVINPLEGDGQISLVEAAGVLTLSGTASITEAGRTVTLDVNGQPFTAIVGPNGVWSVDLPANTLSNLNQDVVIKATLSDEAGNTTTTTNTIHVASDPAIQPSITINPFGGDNAVDGAEVKTAQILTGTTSHVEAGQVVTIKLNGHTYTAEVQQSGSWSIIVPLADMQALSNGSQTIDVSVADKAGNPATGSDTFTVDTTANGVAIDPVTGDNVINAVETENGIAVTGTTYGVTAGTIVTIKFGLLTHTAIVQADGKWSTMFTSPELAGIDPGNTPLTVSTFDSSGNPLNNSVQVGVDNVSPVPTIAAPFGDGFLNISESGTPQTLSGTTGKIGEGQTVVVTLGTHNYTATVDANGNWTVSIPSADLKALSAGDNPIVVHATDSAGNPGTLNSNVFVDLSAPALTVAPLTGDNLISSVEAAGVIALSGTASVSEAGKTVTLTLHGSTYTAIVGADGNWTVNIPAGALNGVASGQYPLTATLTDAAGNTTTVTSNVTLATGTDSQPTLTLNAFAGNNILDGAEQNATQTLSGTTTHVEAGQTVTITLAGKTYIAEVQPNGSWSVQVTSADLLLLDNTSYTLSANVSDKAGNPAQGSLELVVNNTLSGLSIDPITGDNKLNAIEANTGINISGTSHNVDVGTNVTVTLNGKVYLAIVGAGGVWTVPVSSGDLQLLGDGPITVKVTAVDATTGKDLTSSTTLDVYTHQLPLPTINAPFGDGYLSTAEATANQTLSGTTGVLGDGQTVIVNFGGKDYTATVTSNGTWTVSIPAADLQALTEAANPNVITVTASDAAGNTAPATSNITVDFTAPTLEFNPIAVDGFIDAAEAGAAITLSGKASAADVGRTVTLTINGQTYLANVDAQGNWTTDVPANTFLGLANGQYTLTATLSDAAGNTTTIDTSLGIYTHLPVPVLNTPFGDGVLSKPETEAIQTLTGNTGAVGANQTVVVNIGGKDFTGTVNSDGSWTVNIPANELSGLQDGGTPLTVTVTDPAGNVGTTTTNVNVDLTPPALTLEPLTGDNVLNTDEVATGFLVQGTSDVGDAGRTVSLVIEGHTYSGVVLGDGTWSVQIPANALADLAVGDHPYSVSITDAAGNPTVVNGTVNVSGVASPLFPTIDAPFGDTILNIKETGEVQTLTGTTGALGAGQTVKVSIGGRDFNAVVTNDGHWSLEVPANALAGLPQGDLTIIVTSTSASGATGSETLHATVDTVAPTLVIDNVAGDNTINAAEILQPVILTGTASTSDTGQTVKVSITLNGTSYDGTVDADGNWSVTLPNDVLQGLGDGKHTFSASLTDAAGNITTVEHDFFIEASPASLPTITFDKISGDDYINAQEKGEALVISGESTNLEEGRVITVTFNNVDYPATVGADGKWTLTLAAGTLNGLGDGELTVTANATSLVGNPATATHDVNVLASAANLPSITISPISGDDRINSTEHGQDLIIKGTSNHLVAGQTINVNLNGKDYSATINPDGTWQTTVPQAAVEALGDQKYTVTATGSDIAQNPATATHDVTVVTAPPLLIISVDTGADTVLNLAEALAGLPVSGKTEAGLTVTVTVNNIQYTTVALGDGTWSLTIPSGDLLAINVDGQLPITATVTDAAGNPSTISVVPEISLAINTLPILTIDPLDFVNLATAADGFQIKGTSTNLADGTEVQVKIAGVDFTGIVTGGVWTVNVGAGELTPQNVAEGLRTVSVSYTDPAGNPASASHSVTVDFTPPLASTIDILFGDGRLNIVEAAKDQIITGKVTADPGQTVTLTIDGKSVSAVVGPDGTWTATIPTATLAGLTDGTNILTVTVTDAAGNPTSKDFSFNTLTHIPPVATVTDSFDGLINLTKASDVNGGSISGTTGITSAGQKVVVNLNGNDFTATVDSTNGTWSLPLTSAALLGLPNGTWVVTVTVTDDAGNSSTKTENITVQLTPPPIPSLDLVFGDGVLNFAESQAGQTISGSTGVTGAGQIVNVYFAGNPSPLLATVGLDGKWTLALTPSELADLGGTGPYSITVVSTDQYGNSSSSVPQTFTVDLNVPTPDITNKPFGLDGVLNIAEAGAPITISGKTGIVGDNQNVKVTIDVNGVPYNATVDTLGNWTLELPAGALSGLTGNPHSINVTATDASGNTASNSLNFTTDFTPPVVAVTNVSTDGYINIAEATAGTTISGTTDGASVKVSIGGVEFAAVVTGGTWSLALNAAQISTLSQGDQPIIVTATDAAGNTSTALSHVGIVTNSGAAPTVTVGAFAGDNVLDYGESRTTQTISGTTTHVEAGRTVTVSVGSLTGLTAVVQGDGSWSLSLTPAQLQTLGGGANNITANVTDIAGNPAPADVHPITVNLTPPATPFLTLDPISTDNIINASDNLSLGLTLTGQYNNSPLAQTISVYINGSAIAVGTFPVLLAGNGTWTVVLATGLVAFPTDGTYNVKVEMAGLGGPTTSITQTVLVDRTPPTLTIGTFAGDDVLSGAEAAAGQTISGTASTTEIGRTVTVTLNGKTYTAVVGTGGAWSTLVPAADLQTAGQGQNTINASITDAAGNTTTAAHNFSTDTVAPLLSVGVLAGDNVLNLAESLLPQLLTGTTNAEDGQIVTIKIAGVTVATAEVAGGVWSASILPSNLSGLLQGPNVLTVSVTDKAGNATSVDVGLNVVFNSLLDLSIVSGLGTTGNTVLNAAALLVGQTISGVTGSAGVGAKVSVLVGGQPVTAEVGANGAWSLVIPPTLLANLPNGPVSLNVVLTDAAGNTKTQVIDLTVGKILPILGNLTSEIGGAGHILNEAAAGVAQTVSGAITAADGTIVKIVVGAQTFTGSVLNGLYSINIPAGSLKALADGVVPVILTATDAAGNVVTQVLNPITVAVHNLPSIVLDPLFGDGVLNALDLTLNQVITGTVKNVAAGTTISVLLGNSGTPLTAIVDAAGHFSVSVPSNLLTGLTNGSLAVNVAITDANGNSATVATSAGINITLPTISLDPLFHNGVLGAVDALTAQTVSGVVNGVTAGTSVKVTLGGKTFLGVTDAGGVFNITLQPGDLKALADGSQTLGVSVVSDVGNIGVLNTPVNIIINNLPKISLDSLFGGDGILNAADLLLNPVISGTVLNAAAGSSVKITFGPLTLNALVDATGHFSAPLAGLDLTNLLNGNATVGVTVTDAAGNTSSASTNISVGIHNLPSIVLNPIFGDGVLNVVDLLTGQTISGTATNVAIGTQVQISLNGKTYTATVGVGGVFSVTVPPLDLKGILIDGLTNVVANVVDATGNLGTITTAVNVLSNALPTVTLDPLFGNGLLNAAQALLTQTISGKTTNAEGSTVTITVAGIPLTGTVKADGTFSISILPSILAGLQDGTPSIGVSITNPAGHTIDTSATVTVGIHLLPTLPPLGLVFGDGYLNLAEAGTNTTLNGTTNIQTGVATINVGGVIHTVNFTGGAWSSVFTAAELKGLADGTTTVKVTITDAVGNSTTQTSPLVVKTHALPAVSLDGLGSLGGLLGGILGSGLTLKGKSLNIGQGGIVSVTLLGTTLGAVVQADGSWQAKFGSEVFSAYSIFTLLAALTGNIVGLQATDLAGNGVNIHVGLASGSTLPAQTLMATESLTTDDTHTLAAVHSTSDTSTTDTTHHAAASTLTDPVATADAGAQAASTDTTAHDETAFSIGGVTLEVTHTGEEIVGTSGNDIIELNTLDFGHIDGGSGIDTLLLAGTNQHLDLTVLGLKVDHIDIFDLGNSGTNSISLNLHEALTVKDNPTDEVIIKGGAGSLVHLVAGSDGAWAETGQRTVDGLTFDVYHNASLSDTNTLGDVLVQHGLHVQQN